METLEVFRQQTAEVNRDPEAIDDKKSPTSEFELKNFFRPARQHSFSFATDYSNFLAQQQSKKVFSLRSGLHALSAACHRVLKVSTASRKTIRNMCLN